MRDLIEWTRSTAIICLAGVGWSDITSGTLKNVLMIAGFCALCASAILSMIEKERQDRRIEKLEKRMRGDVTQDD